MQAIEQIRDFVLGTIINVDRRGLSIDDNQSILKSGLVNSMAIVEIIGFLEQNFKIDITDASIDIDDFDTIESISRLVTKT